MSLLSCMGRTVQLVTLGTIMLGIVACGSSSDISTFYNPKYKGKSVYKLANAGLSSFQAQEAVCTNIEYDYGERDFDTPDNTQLESALESFDTHNAVCTGFTMAYLALRQKYVNHSFALSITGFSNSVNSSGQTVRDPFGHMIAIDEENGVFRLAGQAGDYTHEVFSSIEEITDYVVEKYGLNNFWNVSVFDLNGVNLLEGNVFDNKYGRFRVDVLPYVVFKDSNSLRESLYHELGEVVSDGDYIINKFETVCKSGPYSSYREDYYDRDTLDLVHSIVVPSSSSISDYEYFPESKKVKIGNPSYYKFIYSKYYGLNSQGEKHISSISIRENEGNISYQLGFYTDYYRLTIIENKTEDTLYLSPKIYYGQEDVPFLLEDVEVDYGDGFVVETFDLREIFATKNLDEEMNTLGTAFEEDLDLLDKGTNDIVDIVKPVIGL